MDARRQPLLARHSEQQRSECFPLFLRKRSEQPVLVLSRDFADRLDSAMAFRRESQRVRAAILRMWCAIDQSAFLQFVDERNQPTGEHTELRRNLLLAATGCQGNHPEESGMCRGQTHGAEPLGKLGGRMRPDLGQQKRRSLRETLGQRAERITE